MTMLRNPCKGEKYQQKNRTLFFVGNTNLLTMKLARLEKGSFLGQVVYGKCVFGGQYYQVWTFP
jgi:hypothetical protein